MYKYEQELINKGVHLIAGCDEAGRGSLAGPIVVAACILPLHYTNELINDSKKMNEKNRNITFKQIKENAIAYNIQILNSYEVDKLNPKQASRVGMSRALKALNIQPEHVLIDFETIEIDIDQQNIIRGDTLSISIAAASILAKVTRDKIMVNYSKKYPKYSFESHKGYGTKKHLMALQKFGITPIHRKSYAPIKQIMDKQK